MLKPSVSFTFQKCIILCLGEYLLLSFLKMFPFLMKNVQSQDKVFLLEIIQENSSGGWSLRRGLRNYQKRKKKKKKTEKSNFSIIFLAFKHHLVVWSRQLYGFFTRSKGKV